MFIMATTHSELDNEVLCANELLLRAITIAVLCGHHIKRRYRGSGNGAEKSYKNSTGIETAAVQ